MAQNKQISLNYGAIRDTILRFASKQLVSEGGKASTIFDSFIKNLKDIPALKIQNIVFKNLEEGKFTKERLAERYISQNLKLMESTDWEKVIEANRNIRISLLENSHVEGQDNKGELYESVHTLIESVCRKGFTDIDKSNDAYDFILNHLLREDVSKPEEEQETEESPKLLSWGFVTNLAVNNFNQRFSHLNENEKNIVKILLSTEENKVNYLEDLKKENFELINSILKEDIDEENEKVLIGFKERMESKLDESIDENIIHLAELKETLIDFRK
jgi:hypothetical protein